MVKRVVWLSGMLALLCVGSGEAQTMANWVGTLEDGENHDVRDVEIEVLDSALPSLRLVIRRAAEPAMESMVTVAIRGVRLEFPINPYVCAVAPLHAEGYSGTCTTTDGDSIRIRIRPPVPGMLFAAHEAELVRDAAPPHLRDDVTVLVFRATGYEEIATGHSGFTCLAERPKPQDFWPICYNSQAAISLVPQERLRGILRTQAVPDSLIADSLAMLYAAGAFRAPMPGAMAYMLSGHAWTYLPEHHEGVTLTPHLHFYTPYATDSLVGMPMDAPPVVPMRLEKPGQPDASVIVGVRVREND